MSKEFTTQQERDKILDRIRKLLAVANGTNFEAEAATALRIAQGFMKTYGLSMSDVELSEHLKEAIVREDVTEGIRSKNPEYWCRILGLAIAMVFDVKCFRTIGFKESHITFAGYKSDVEMAKMVFAAMYVAIRAAACKAIPFAGKSRLSFMLGVAVRLNERANEEKQTATAEPSGKFALVVQTKADRVNAWLAERTKLQAGRSYNGSVNSAAFAMGRKHGDSMDLMNREKVQSQPTALLRKA